MKNENTRARCRVKGISQEVEQKDRDGKHEKR